MYIKIHPLVPQKIPLFQCGSAKGQSLRETKLKIVLTGLRLIPANTGCSEKLPWT